jgi:hypothetical protein
MAGHDGLHDEGGGHARSAKTRRPACTGPPGGCAIAPVRMAQAAAARSSPAWRLLPVIGRQALAARFQGGGQVVAQSRLVQGGEAFQLVHPLVMPDLAEQVGERSVVTVAGLERPCGVPELGYSP